MLVFGIHCRLVRIELVLIEGEFVFFCLNLGSYSSFAHICCRGPVSMVIVHGKNHFVDENMDEDQSQCNYAINGQNGTIVIDTWLTNDKKCIFKTNG